MKEISSQFRLKLKVKSADWIDFDTLRIYINTEGTGAKWGKPVTAPPTPFVERKITPNPREKNVDGIIFKWREFETDEEISPAPSTDFWVVVEVTCSPEKCGGDKNPMFPVIVNRSVLPILITNPIYIDVDGDGEFNPPRPTYFNYPAPKLSEKTEKRADKSERVDLIRSFKEALKLFMKHEMEHKGEGE